MPYGCYSGQTGKMVTTDGVSDNWSHLIYPFQSLDGPICMSHRIKWTFLSFLLFIQVLSLIWLSVILRIAVHVVRTGGSAEDTRSDDEDAEEPVGNGAARANTVDRAAVAIDGSNSDGPWRQSVISSGSNQNHHPVRIRTARGRVTLSDQNERKELLGRIGCDKPT